MSDMSAASQPHHPHAHTSQGSACDGAPRLLLHRLCRLAATALAALAAHRTTPACQRVLSAPRVRPAPAGDGGAWGGPANWMVEAVLALITPDSWANLPLPPALTPAAAAATVLATIAGQGVCGAPCVGPSVASSPGSSGGLMRQAAQLLLACTGQAQGAGAAGAGGAGAAAGSPQPVVGGGGGGGGGGGVSCAETLVTQLVVRRLALPATLVQRAGPMVGGWVGVAGGEG